MTITQELLRRSLVINVEDGVNADGSIKTNTLSGIMLSDRSELIEE